MFREGRHIFADMSVEENLIASTFAQRLAPIAQGGHSTRFIHTSQFFLSGDISQPVSYSGGEQQMLAIGRALVADPDMILLDEPSLGLCPTHASKRSSKSLLESTEISRFQYCWSSKTRLPH